LIIPITPIGAAYGAAARSGDGRRTSIGQDHCRPAAIIFAYRISNNYQFDGYPTSRFNDDKPRATGHPEFTRSGIMTLSLYSTYKAMRRDAAAERATRKTPAASPIHTTVLHTLALLGMGIEGVACGGDDDTTRRRQP